MTTDIKKAITEFNECWKNHYCATYDELESYAGYYVVYVTDLDFGISARYVFETLTELYDWTSGVCMY